MAAPPEPRPWFVCISLRGAVERRRFMSEQFERLGLGFDFFDAIEPDPATYASDADYDARFRERAHGRQMSRGEVGCYRSHLAVWRALAQGDRDVACVIEDDVRLGPGFGDAVDGLVAGPVDWDFVRLSSLFERRWRRRVRDVAPGLALVDFFDAPRGTQAYLIRRDAARRMAAALARIRYAIDEAVDRTWDHGCRVHSVLPSVAEENRDLVSTIPGRARVRVPVPVMLRREAARLAGDLHRVAGFAGRALLPRRAGPGAGG